MNNKDSFREIDVGQLKLDRQNPRLPEQIKGKDTRAVLNWMLSDATLIDLMASIAENGFFPGEPIIAMNDGNGHVVSLEKAEAKLAPLRSDYPDAAFWPEIVAGLRKTSPGCVKEEAARYNTSGKPRTTKARRPAKTKI